MSSEKGNPPDSIADGAKQPHSTPSRHSAASLEADNEKSSVPVTNTSPFPTAAEAELQLKKLDSKVVKAPGKDETPDPFAHLPPHEAEILRRQVDTPDISVGYFGLFKYASSLDWLIFALALFCAIVAGAAMPLMTVGCGQAKHAAGNETDLICRLSLEA
jgi:ATP-binding cassette subfamily B (MDR/TAP) protein 1